MAFARPSSNSGFSRRTFLRCNRRRFRRRKGTDPRLADQAALDPALRVDARCRGSSARGARQLWPAVTPRSGRNICSVQSHPRDRRPSLNRARPSRKRHRRVPSRRSRNRRWSVSRYRTGRLSASRGAGVGDAGRLGSRRLQRRECCGASASDGRLRVTVETTDAPQLHPSRRRYQADSSG